MAELIEIEPEPLGADVIPALEGALAKAKAGEISSLGIAIVYRSGESGQIWSKASTAAALLGSIHRLAHKFQQEMDEKNG